MMPLESSSSTYWLLKSEPSTWSWHDQRKAQTTSWDGVRNYQASHNLKAMKRGDLAFFYHSGRISSHSPDDSSSRSLQGPEKSIVGIVKVSREYYPDPSDSSGRFGMVDVTYVDSLPSPISLRQIKEDPLLHNLALVRQSRLSVMPISHSQWDYLLTLGGL